jgi:Baseplate J-like protein
MSTPVSNIPISVDYTSKDYYAVRQELIARIQDRIPEWTASDPADFGVALVEAFAYIADLLNYYIDRSANEAFITTATQRQSVLNIAQTYGYVPAGYRQSLVDLQFSNTSDSVITVPSGTVVSGDVVIGDTVQTVYFTTNVEIEVPAAVGESPGTETITGYNGRPVSLVADNVNTYGELIGTSTGLPNMSFDLGETPVVDDSIEIYVQDGDVFSKWTQVQHILDYGPNDLVFTTYLNDNDTVTITFGDGISGVIPTLYSEIRANYTVGGGAIGNITNSVIDTISYVPGLSESQTTALQADLTVTNTSVGIGGSDPESTEEIRSVAPLTLRSNNRAVTLQDYADLALSVSGVGKANATASIWTSVTLYIAPTRNATDTDQAPGLDELGAPTEEYDRLKSDVTTFLEDKILLGTSVTIQPPTYVDLAISITYTKLSQYTTTEIEKAIKAKLLSDFGYNGMNFQDTIYAQDIEFSLAQVPGVKVVDVTQLQKEGLTATSASGNGTTITYTLSDNPSFAVGSKVSVTGLTPSGYNVTNATVTAVGTNTFSVAGTTTGSSSGTGVITGICIMTGTPGEIFRTTEANTTVSGS